MLGAYFTVVYSFGLTRINQFCWIQRTRFCQPQLEKAAKLATRGPVTKASVTSTQPASMDGTRKGGNQIPTVYLLESSISRISPPYLKSKTPQNPPRLQIPISQLSLSRFPRYQWQSQAFFICWVMRMGGSKRPSGLRVRDDYREQNANRRP